MTDFGRGADGSYFNANETCFHRLFPASFSSGEDGGYFNDNDEMRVQAPPGPSPVAQLVEREMTAIAYSLDQFPVA